MFGVLLKCTTVAVAVVVGTVVIVSLLLAHYYTIGITIYIYIYTNIIPYINYSDRGGRALLLRNRFRFRLLFYIYFFLRRSFPARKTPVCKIPVKKVKNYYVNQYVYLIYRHRAAISTSSAVCTRQPSFSCKFISVISSRA